MGKKENLKRSFFHDPELTLPTKGNETYQFILGKRDREMDMIEDLLCRNKQRFQYATSGGIPVTPRNCYEADQVVVADGHTVVLVECEPKALVGFHGKPRVIDHHRPLDPGFEFPPSHYFEGSSIGQTWKLLKRKHKLKKPGKAYLIAAARDHCRFAAARGECPGVTAKEVTIVGRRWLAQELEVTRAELDEKIRKMVRTIDRSPVIRMENQDIVDLRKISVSEIYSLDYFGVYEALADLSCGAIVRTGNLKGQGDKYVLLGDLVSSTVKHFKDEWGPSVGLQDIYGCEVRGHAGGYFANPIAKMA